VASPERRRKPDARSSSLRMSGCGLHARGFPLKKRLPPNDESRRQCITGSRAAIQGGLMKILAITTRGDVRSAVLRKSSFHGHTG